MPILVQGLLNLHHRNPYPVYCLLRRFKPVAYLPPADLWIVARYDHVKRVLSEHATFSSDFAARQQPGPSSRVRSLVSSDPPVHTKLRGLVSKAFTARIIADLEPRIEMLTHQLLDHVVDSGRIDLVQDLAYPLPVTVIAEMLGVPVADRGRFKAWSDALIAWTDQAFLDPDAALEASNAEVPPPLRAEMAPYFMEILEQRRADPREDLISALIAAEVDGERLTDADLLQFCWLLLVAGNVTTTNLIGNAISTFLEHPEVLSALRTNDEVLTDAIEEVLRFRSPVQMMFRMTKCEIELADETIREGARVMALIGSANRDETQFVQADAFIPRRNPNPHIAFGFGIHYCLGAPLARLEARVALRAVLDRLAGLTRIDTRQLPRTDGLILYGVKSLPLRFIPPSRVFVAA